MVLTFIAGFAATFGAAEGIRAAQNKSRREEHRSRKNNLIVRCARGSKYSPLLEGRRVVLSGEKLYVDTGTEYSVPFGHPFEGYFLPYPAQPHAGLVSTITHEAPVMNWVFVHAGTHEVRFGPRAASEGNATGPWDCTRQDKRLTFAGWEGFCAVREGAFWALYFDREGDGLGARVSRETPVVEVGLLRVEMRVGRPVEVSEEEREKMEAEAKEQAERAAALKVQEEALREAIRKAQEAEGGEGNGQGQKSAPDQESKSASHLAQQETASPQGETRPGQRPQTPQQQAQPQSTSGRKTSRPPPNLASPQPKGHDGGTSPNENTNKRRNGRAFKGSSNPSTPTSARSGSGSEASGRERRSGAKARKRRGAGNGSAGGKGAGRGGGSGSSDASPASGRSSPPSSYPSDKDLAPSPDVD